MPREANGGSLSCFTLSETSTSLNANLRADFPTFSFPEEKNLIERSTQLFRVIIQIYATVIFFKKTNNKVIVFKKLLGKIL